MAEAGKTDMPDAERAVRRRRVRRLKKLILGTVAALILIPVCLCVILIVRVTALQSRVEALSEQVAVLQQELTENARQESAALSGTETESSEVLTDAVGAAGTRTDVTEVSATAGADETSDADAQTADEQVAHAQIVHAQVAHKVYLTFDDGPSVYTDEILDILAEYDVKATFFVVGKEGSHAQEMLQRIVNEGHTLGMHSYSHKYAELYASEESFTEDLERLRSYLYDVTGVESRFYRFPGGSSNTVSQVDMETLAEDLETLGIAYFDWNISSGDGGSTLLDADTLTENATAEIAAHETAVILMHDSAEKETTVEALPQIIETIQLMEDTVILPITDDTTPIHHIEPET